MNTIMLAFVLVCMIVVDAGNVNISVFGDPVDVWSAVDTLHKCNIIDTPDIPSRVFQDDKNTTHMVVGSTTFHHMFGPSPLVQNRSCAVSYNETGDANPAMFAASEWLDSTYAFDNGTVVSLVHTEYAGNLYGNCSGPSYPYCWTVTIGLMISHDWGLTWKHALPPPHHLVAAVPYQYNQSQLASGWGDPSNIVQHPSDGHYYVAFWNRNQVGLQPPGICVARTPSLLTPSAWRGWNGTHFSVSFVSPYTLPPGTEAEHVCHVVNLPEPSCAALGLVYSEYLSSFVVTLGCMGDQGRDFYFATSTDLTTWSEAQPFYNQADLPANVSKVTTNMNYPAFIDPTAPKAFGDRNYQKIGQYPYLFWVSIGHSPYTDGRNLWATPMKFTKT